jgi:hypothetical protein
MCNILWNCIFNSAMMVVFSLGANICINGTLFRLYTNIGIANGTPKKKSQLS